MKNKILLLAITLFVDFSFVQQKGTSQLPTVNRLPQSRMQTSTYAIVVGISDYQNPAIPDLHYADKDAEVYANYLRSNAGGKLDNDH